MMSGVSLRPRTGLRRPKSFRGFLVAVLALCLYWRGKVRRWVEEDQLEREQRHQEEALAIAYAPTPIVAAPEARHPLDAVPYPIKPSDTQRPKA